MQYCLHYHFFRYFPHLPQFQRPLLSSSYFHYHPSMPVSLIKIHHLSLLNIFTFFIAFVTEISRYLRIFPLLKASLVVIRGDLAAMLDFATKINKAFWVLCCANSAKYFGQQILKCFPGPFKQPRKNPSNDRVTERTKVYIGRIYTSLVTEAHISGCIYMLWFNFFFGFKFFKPV